MAPIVGGRPAALLDRDGTLVADSPYRADPKGLTLLPGVAEGLRRLRAAGYALVLITNQSGIGRGYFTEADLARVQARLRDLLAEAGVVLDALYHCPHAPEAGCDCRKPAPGMALRAARELGLDLGASVVIGDKAADTALARAVGATGVLVGTGETDLGDAAAVGAAGAEIVAPDFGAAVDAVLARAAPGRRPPGQEA